MDPCLFWGKLWGLCCGPAEYALGCERGLGPRKDQDLEVSREPLPQGMSTDGLGMTSSHCHRIEKAETTGSVLLSMVSWGAHHSNAIQNLGGMTSKMEPWALLTFALPFLLLFSLSCPLTNSPTARGLIPGMPLPVSRDPPHYPFLRALLTPSGSP